MKNILKQDLSLSGNYPPILKKNRLQRVIAGMKEYYSRNLTLVFEMV